MTHSTILLVTCCVASLHSAQGDVIPDRFSPIDIFELEFASDPQVSPDGQRIVYIRNFMDVMKDVRRSTLWSMNFDGSDHRPLTTGSANDSSPRWSPDGVRWGRYFLIPQPATKTTFSRWSKITAEHLSNIPSPLVSVCVANPS